MATDSCVSAGASATQLASESYWQVFIILAVSMVLNVAFLSKKMASPFSRVFHRNIKRIGLAVKEREAMWMVPEVNTNGVSVSLSNPSLNLGLQLDSNNYSDYAVQASPSYDSVCLSWTPSQPGLWEHGQHSISQDNDLVIYESDAHLI